MKSKTAIDLFSFLLILLYIYTAVSKLSDFTLFKRQMYAQTLPHWFATFLIWTLPELEILTAFLLLFKRTKVFGYSISFFLMTLFTGYILLVLLNYFGRVPCSCGGVIKALGWKMHLLFNFLFLLLSLTGILIIRKERRLIATIK
jgi:putative oxidoreductase